MSTSEAQAVVAEFKKGDRHVTKDIDGMAEDIGVDQLDNALSNGRVRDPRSWVQSSCSRVMMTFPFLRPVST